MQITGKKSRSLAERGEVSFLLSGSINNITGSGLFGLSGATQGLQFNFESGKIYDPENKYFNSYSPDEIFQLSGNISGSKYDYYFNKAPISYLGSRTDEKITGLYLDASGCTMDVSPFVVSDKYPYNFTFPSTFITGAPLTGTLAAEGTSDTFEVFSGFVKSPPSWRVTGFDAGRVTTSNIKLQSTGTLENNLDYVVNFVLYTNFGEIEKTITGKALSNSSTDGSTLMLADAGGFAQTGLAWNVSETVTGEYNLMYDLVNYGEAITENKPIEIKLTNNSNSSGVMTTGYAVTGVQLRGKYQNGFFLDTPSVSFSSNHAGDSQASGTALMADYMVADFWSGTPGVLSSDLSGVVVKTVTGIRVDNSGSYLTPTGINVSLTNPSLSVSYPNPCYFYKYSRLPLQSSSAGVQYQTSVERKHWYYDNTRSTDNLYTELTGVDVGAIALAGSGTGTYNREMTGVWQLVTGTNSSQEKYAFNSVDGPWGSGVDEINHVDGIKVNAHKEYYDSSTTSDSSFSLRLKSYLPKTKVSVNSDNYLGITQDQTYQNNYGTASVQKDYYTHFPELRDLITGKLFTGGTGEINLTYSFVKSGTTGRLFDGATVGVYQDIAYSSQGSEPSLTTGEITGEFVSAFSEWKNLLETVYTGLTINFSNNGIETSTSVPIYVDAPTYSMPNSSDSLIGDIRIGLISGTSSNLGWAIVTGGFLNLSGDEVGDIVINNTRRLRLDSDNTNTGTCYSLKYIATHEIGHSLGFGHDRDKSGIMHYTMYTDDTFSGNFPNGLSGSFRNQDMVKNFHSYTVNPEHKILKAAKASGHKDVMSVNLYISGSGLTPINQVITGVTPSGYSI